MRRLISPMKVLLSQFIVFCCLLLAPSTHASSLSHYRAALQALAEKNHEEYQVHLDAMKDYLLKPVVEFEYLKAQLDSLDEQIIEDFIVKNSDVYVSGAMKKLWLRRLAKQKDWQRFDAHYDDAVSSTELECHHLYRRIRAEGISTEMDARIQKLWLTRIIRPSSCIGVFKRWQRAGKLTDELFWQRIVMMLRKDKEKKAHSLAKTYLPADEQYWMDHWVSVHKNPLAKLSNPQFSIDSELGARLVVSGIEELAREDPSEADRLSKQLLKQHKFLRSYQAAINEVIGYRAAINHQPNATQWLRKAPADKEKIRQWAIRTALREGKWKDVLYFYDKLTAEEKASPDWRYWQARALEKLKKKNQAKKIYKQIADQREYYSFLAADKLENKYQLNDKPIKASTKALAQSRPFKIAKELAEIDEPDLMRRQWQWAIRNLNDKELLAAAKLAQKWKFTDRAIFTAARAKHYDDVALRFPVIYKQVVKREAKAKRLPPAYVYGIMRQESAFMEKVRSPAGAIGLMQIMPGTGRVIARKQKNGKYRSNDLFDSNINIEMGTFYLRQMLDKFGGNYAMATAAYNAGPRRPRQWQGNEPLDADIWIENIPFNETRSYVKKVMLYKAIYHDQLGLKHESISKILTPVPGTIP